MADTYQAKLTVTGRNPNDNTLEIYRTAGTDCTELAATYRNQHFWLPTGKNWMTRKWISGENQDDGFNQCICLRAAFGTLKTGCFYDTSASPPNLPAPSWLTSSSFPDYEYRIAETFKVEISGFDGWIDGYLGASWAASWPFEFDYGEFPRAVSQRGDVNRVFSLTYGDAFTTSVPYSCTNSGDNYKFCSDAWTKQSNSTNWTYPGDTYGFSNVTLYLRTRYKWFVISGETFVQLIVDLRYQTSWGALGGGGSLKYGWVGSPVRVDDVTSSSELGTRLTDSFSAYQSPTMCQDWNWYAVLSGSATTPSYTLDFSNFTMGSIEVRPAG